MSKLKDIHQEEQADAVVEEIISATEFAMAKFSATEANEKIVGLILSSIDSLVKTHGPEHAIAFHLHLTSSVLKKIVEARKQ